MNKPLRYTIFSLMWVAVAAYIVYATASSARARRERKVQRLEINVADSTSQGHLVSTQRVRGWVKQSGIATVGQQIDAVDLSGIEELIARNGFVSRVKAWVAYDGTLRVEIHQRRPLLRLLTDGTDSYVTSDGYVFTAPRASALYVPVVTGSYRLPFPVSYVGRVRDHIDESRAQIDKRIEELEREKYPFYKRELQNDRNISALRRKSIKRRWWRLESTEEFEKKVEELRKEKADLRRVYRYEARLIQQGIERVAAKQEAERLRQKKLEKSYEDFTKLLTFVESVEKDAFWRSEIVQIVARTTPSGALEVELVPRSGRHTVLFGRLEQTDRKLEKLLRFYRNGLSRIGWDVYRTIDIRYADQVVCKK